MERNFGAVQGTRHRGHCCFRVVAFFPWKSGWDGVFGDVLVTLWYALVMCWVYSRGDGDGGRSLVNVDEDGWTSVVHNFESGKACSSGSSKNLNPLLQYIQCSLKNRQKQYHGVSSI
jgi:hypothetical protein